jgi:hypothetical protein
MTSARTNVEQFAAQGGKRLADVSGNLETGEEAGHGTTGMLGRI